MHSGKLEFETLAKILLLTAFLIIVLLLFKGCLDAKEQVGSVGIKEYTCWATNLMKEYVVQIWPTTCRNLIIKEEADKKLLGNVMGKCWWQYGQGRWDLGAKQEFSSWDDYLAYLGKAATPVEMAYTCYTLIPKEDIKIDELKQYMEINNAKGDKAKKIEDNMWNYIQAGSQGDNICFDNSDKGMLKKGGIYYIKFVDDRAAYGAGKRDMLLISSDKKFFEKGMLEKENWPMLFNLQLCYKYGTAGVTGLPNKAEELRQKIEACKDQVATEETYCNMIDFTTEYKVFAKYTKGAESPIITIKKEGQTTNIPILSKDIELDVVCPGKNQPLDFVNTIVFDDKPAPCRADGGYCCDANCCELKGVMNIRAKPDRGSKIIKNVILKQENTPTQTSLERAENFFINFVESAKRCKSTSNAADCKCEKIEFSTMHNMATIKGKQDGNNAMFYFYYNNKPINYAKLENTKIGTMTATFSDVKAPFERWDEKKTLNKDSETQYLVLTKNNEIALANKLAAEGKTDLLGTRVGGLPVCAHSQKIAAG